MYDFAEVNALARQATTEIERWLRNHPETLELSNVEADPVYQQQDVDLLWHTQRQPQGYKLEVKVDRYYQTGNFFFETHSNLERNTPGCFLYSAADLLLYYFIPERQLFILPLPETRSWFLGRQAEFAIRDTRTPLQNGYYTTRGCLVPRSRVLRAVPAVSCYGLLKASKE
jgi:hypothetical protein